MSLFEYIQRLDKILFILINHDSDHKLLDNLMLAIRNPYTWIPLYLFMIAYIIKKSAGKALLIILLSILTVLIADGFTGLLLNPLTERLRPCYDPEIHNMVRLLFDSGGLYSFPSPYAAIIFGLATFWFWSLRKLTAKKWKWLWVWASLICYAQIYVGNYFPLDIAAGAVLGWAIGIGMARIFEIACEKRFHLINVTPEFKKA